MSKIVIAGLTLVLWFACPPFARCHLHVDFPKCSLRCGEDEHHHQSKPGPSSSSRNGNVHQAQFTEDQIKQNESCIQTAFVFPRRSSHDYIRVKTPLSPIDNFTVCTWVKRYGSGIFTGTILSYATIDDSNALLIMFQSEGLTIISGTDEIRNIKNPLKSGDQQHICVTIERSAGIGKVYYNGTLSSTLTFRNRDAIAAGGTFVIGQDQDSPVGGFDISQSLTGDIKNYMTWNRVLTDSEISDMYESRCYCAPAGHSVSLLPDNVQLVGAVNGIHVGNECD